MDAFADTVRRIHDLKTAGYERRVAQGEVALRPGVLALIGSAHAAGLRLAIATTTSPVNIAALLCAIATPVGQMSLLTNAISRQMLLDALQGQFAERLTDVVRCICDGGDVAATTLLALRTGHSSGADVLCGLLFGYSLAPAASAIREDGVCQQRWRKSCRGSTGTRSH